ncbi:serine/threonine protein kinase/ABC-type amino acid transport substrate-binding protein [Nonomuraea muscovyensis]|uniref:Serine/threonine protein kinase/ABC-type amino acid transport substrate-binding protein n=1 Tax=Nonomuraea muscovyensis TaxID=1124761 RepID=A0A7X0F2I4_9ACTN|nr:bifunctional serine/threonine-protein kinase/glutamate ABC transporter substrate-binding protein [Nonomuraea muscovyensis]MBB6350600.1 serine/threonine protein kinase/ABC-type amino acid transport substrate-binding protein [Nonomuraea muscovyensis]
MPQISPLVTGDPGELGSFRLTGRIGEGGQGIVYLGVDDQGEQAAIKLLHVKFSGDTIARSRFARELKAAKRVASFCTARVIEADLDGDTPYIASEYIEGRALREIVDTDGPLRGTVLDRLAIGTATALTAIHHASIVHRDFKPDNVLIAADGPRVVDFGIARIIDSSGTITSRAIGTPAYMAPEQIAGEDVGPYTDVFAWGATIAFAATGKVAFEGNSIAVVLNRILNHEVDVSPMPEPLRGVVRSALAKSPQERPSADQILLRLLGQPETTGASTAVLSRGAEVAGDDTTPFLRVSPSLADRQTGTGGTSASLGGTSSPTGGTSSRSDATSAHADGTPSRTGGTSARTGGTSARTDGTSARTDGTSAQRGGTSAQTGGTSLPAGEASARTGGASAPYPGGGGPPHAGAFPAQSGTSPQYAGASTQLSAQSGGPLAPYPAGPQPQAGAATPAEAHTGGPPAPATPPPGLARRSRRRGWWLALATTVLLLCALAVVAVLRGWSPLAFGEEPGLSGGDTTGGTGNPASVVDRAAATGKLVIGVKGDLPGIGLERDGGFEGFDVELAKKVAAALGAKQTEFVRASRGDRADLLADGTVDLVFATYSIDEADENKVSFAGPYYLAHQDLLVRSGSGIETIDDLVGKKICAINSPSVGKVQDRVKVKPVTAGNYAECMDLLRSGGVDAVPGDDLILAGFASRENLRFKVLGAKLTNERYAVGIRRGDARTCEAVNAVIADLYRTGAMKELLTSHFKNVEFDMELKRPVMEACR